MLGQLVAPSGRPLTLVVQLLVLEEMEKSLGKATLILASVPAPADDGWAQIVPERGALAV